MPAILIAILAVYQILLFFVHAAVYKTIVDAFGWQSIWVAWLFGILSISFVTASVLSHKSKKRAVVWYYRVSAYWFGLIHFLFIGTFAFYILEVIIYGHNHYVSPAILGGLSLGILFLVHTYATWQTTRPKVTRITVALPNLPDFWKNKKVIFISDLHLGAIWDGNLTSKIVAIIKAEAPESLWIGGDVFDGVKCHSEASLKPMSELQIPSGMFFVTGNHEYIRDINEFLNAIRATGIRILNNEVVDLHGLQLVGVDWKDTHKATDCERILRNMNIDATKPSILMKHEPNDLRVSAFFGISLQLSGHTHAGQIFPLSFITHRVYRGFDYGLKRFRDMMVFTSSGVGAWGPPLRFGTKSEVAVLTFVQK